MSISFPGGMAPLASVVYAQTPANFPACKFFVQCTQDDIQNKYLTDIMGGVRLLAPNIIQGSDVFSIKPNLSGGGSKIGTFPPPAGNPFIYLEVGKFGTGQPLGDGSLTLGDKVNGPAIYLSSSSSALLIGSDGWSYGGGPVSATSAAIGRAMVVTNYNSATGSQYLECYPGTNGVFTAFTSGRTDQTIDPVVTPLVLNTLESSTATKWSSSSAIDGIYGAALFIFQTAIPYDYVSAISSMVQQWVLGNKSIYSGWKGVV